MLSFTYFCVAHRTALGMDDVNSINKTRRQYHMMEKELQVTEQYLQGMIGLPISDLV